MRRGAKGGGRLGLLVLIRGRVQFESVGVDDLKLVQVGRGDSAVSPHVVA
jgi:hypothetical protein